MICSLNQIMSRSFWLNIIFFEDQIQMKSQMSGLRTSGLLVFFSKGKNAMAKTVRCGQKFKAKVVQSII